MFLLKNLAFIRLKNIQFTYKITRAKKNKIA
jgi:hypothetical protein